MKEVCIVGLGYIGLPTSAMFASHGVKVKGVDVRGDVCAIINSGRIHIVEPGLEEYVREAVKNGMLTASTEVQPCDNFIISVPTPITKDKKADLSYVASAAASVSKVLKKGDLVILESTVSPRCTLDVLIPELEKSGLKAGADFKVAHCPERVLPGQILFELENNNRIVGGINRESAYAARDLYGTFVKGEMIITDTTTAEMCKLMENTFRDVNIALANELAKLCEKLEINAWEVIANANKHPRVNLHQPGPGVGGHCLAVDPWFIVEAAPDIAKIINLSRMTNDSMPHHVLKRVEGIVPKGSKVVLLGCTYKPDVDDMRESPVMELYELLNEEGYSAYIVDPYVMQFNNDLYETLQGADLAVLAVNHKVFANIDFNKMKGVMAQANFLDTRNYFKEEALQKAGFQYYLLGDGRKEKFL